MSVSGNAGLYAGRQWYIFFVTDVGDGQRVGRVISGIYDFVCVCVRALTEKRIELSTRVSRGCYENVVVEFRLNVTWQTIPHLNFILQLNSIHVAPPQHRELIVITNYCDRPMILQPT